MSIFFSNGEIKLSGEFGREWKNFELIDFIPISKNRKYNSGLDENNKYPEDYYKNYADLLRS